MIIKICGIQNKDTLLCCEKNNVNFFGMIFYSKSPRNITIENANKLNKISKKLNINGVGVFVNEAIDDLNSFIKETNLTNIQLHGYEDNEYIRQLKKNKIRVIKKISIQSEHDLNTINMYPDADYYLFDYKPNKNELPGGNAKSFDWEIISYLNTSKPWFLSGGVNLKNIDHLTKNIKPFGVDLSSGVEKELGIKDNDIINNLMNKINYA